MKYITFTVPCYNSQDYMERCIDTLLAGEELVEIIIVDDGSTDRTGEIADNYARNYPETVKVIHQENGGHGAGINAGLAQAQGLYFKVVDSDDWLNEKALLALLEKLRQWHSTNQCPDLIIGNYIKRPDLPSRTFRRLPDSVRLPHGSKNISVQLSIPSSIYEGLLATFEPLRYHNTYTPTQRNAAYES